MKKLKWPILALLALMLNACEKSKEVGSASSLIESQTILTEKSTSSLEFTVLTYNIAGLLEPFSSSNPSEYTPIISGLINAYDVVQVQEDFNYHAALYDTDNEHTYRTSTSGGMGIGDGLNTLSYYPFTDFTREEWDDCSGTDCLTPKGLTWMKLRMQEGVYIDLYNLHTNAGVDDDDLEARQANVIQFVEFVEEHSEGNAFIITGDFNCRYTRSGDNIRLVSSELDATDTWIELIMDGYVPEKGSDAIVCEDDSVILTDFTCEVVDKIFYHSNNYIQLSATEFTYEDATFRNDDGEALSDHRPLMTRFSMELSEDIQMSDQFGGPHGTPYNDVNDLPESPAVQTVGIRSGSRIDQVNISLSDGTTFLHGGSGGSASSLTLNSGEYVKEVTLCSGKKDDQTRIFYIEFTTSADRTLSGGTTTDDTETYTAPDGWQIVGFHGRSGDELDKCGVIYAPVN